MKHYDITVKFLDGGTRRTWIGAVSLAMAVDLAWEEFPYAASIDETPTFDLDQLVDDAEARFIRFVNEIADRALREHRAAFQRSKFKLRSYQRKMLDSILREQAVWLEWSTPSISQLSNYVYLPDR